MPIWAQVSESGLCLFHSRRVDASGETPTPRILCSVDSHFAPGTEIERRTELDGLRGVAISMVRIWHYVCNTLTVDNVHAAILQIVIGLFWSGVDLFHALAKLVLATHGRKVNIDQYERFLDLYKAYLLRSNQSFSYVERWTESIEITEIKKLGKKKYAAAFLLTSQSNTKARIQFRIRKSKTSSLPYKLCDVVVAGISLIRTHTREFGGILNRDGIDGLKQVLERKVKFYAGSHTHWLQSTVNWPLMTFRVGVKGNSERTSRRSGSLYLASPRSVR